ncbi:hypothetical protein I352_04004 [Cryptococcus deuterogattii MMRL2647]|nr:hypothetical protein I352_04004 [Cryptococcus deuterogattii MMRL2647]
MRFIWLLEIVVCILLSLADTAHSLAHGSGHSLKASRHRHHLQPHALLSPEQGHGHSTLLLPRSNSTAISSNATDSDSVESSAGATLPTSPSTVVTTPPSPMPTPLDLSISTSLSSSCMLYLTSLVSSETFLYCLPFSLLLTTSTAYSSIVAKALASHNYTTLNDLVAYTSSPQPSIDQCETYMYGVMTALTSKSNCASDISKNVPVAVKTKWGVGNYRVMREAESLVNEDTGVFCYIEAVASKRPDDLYLWGLPGGISLPSSSMPSCTKCSASLLKIYGSYVSNTTTLNSTVINAAVKRVNEACGSSFVNFGKDTQVSGDLSHVAVGFIAGLKGAVAFASIMAWILTVHIDLN